MDLRAELRGTHVRPNPGARVRLRRVMPPQIGFPKKQDLKTETADEDAARGQPGPRLWKGVNRSRVGQRERLGCDESSGEDRLSELS